MVDGRDLCALLSIADSVLSEQNGLTTETQKHRTNDRQVFSFCASVFLWWIHLPE